MTLDLKDRLYTSSEVAEILGVSLRSVYRYLEEGKLDADIKTATGRHRFSRKNILDFLQPGGITKEQAEERIFKELEDDEEEFNVLDLPAISKSKKSQDSDDFSFDLDEDFFKSLDFNPTNEPKNNIESENNSVVRSDLSKNNSKVEQGEYIDDDLEKLLREFEEKEGLLDEDVSTKPATTSSHSTNLPKNPSHRESSFVDEDDFDLDSFFKELEESEVTKPEAPAKQNFNNLNPVSTKDDFDFDIDLDFLDELDLDTKPEVKKESEPVAKREAFSSANSSQDNQDSEDNSEDNWLERFRKAAQKNTSSDSSAQKDNDKLNSSFFEKSNLDHFFDSPSNKSVDSTTSIGFDSFIGNKESKTAPELKTAPRTREFYYTSSLNGLKEIAQNIDKISRKFDTDYAFTMNAGLSLHKPISPFSIIHSYVRERDLELFEDYLNLTSVESPSEASVCLMVPEDSSLFEDAYELHGLFVVSNVQLRSDLIDKGLEKLAREI